jgi:hypothetical protein
VSVDAIWLLLKNTSLLSFENTVNNMLGIMNHIVKIEAILIINKIKPIKLYIFYLNYRKRLIII